MSEGEYRHAVAFTGFRTCRDQYAVHRSPTAYATYHADRIYFAVLSPLRKGESLRWLAYRRDSSKVSMDDAIELFFYHPANAAAMERYYQLACNARGAIFDARYSPSTGQVAPHWAAHWRLRSTVSEGLWLAEISAPFADIGVAPAEDGSTVRFDLCRDSPSFNVHFTSLAGAFHIRARAAEAVLREAGPAIQITSLGDLNAGELAVAGRIVNGGSEPLHTRTDVEVTSAGKTVFRRAIESRVQGEAAEELSATGSLGGIEEGVLSIRVTNDTASQTYFRQILPFRTGVPDKPVEAAIQPPVALEAKPAPSFGKLRADIDLYSLPAKHDADCVVLEVTREDETAVVAAAKVGTDAFENDVASEVVAVPGLRKGEYVVTAKVLARDGRKLGRATDRFQVRHYPWIGNRIGITDKVVGPFTSLRVHDGRVECWGRTYVLSGSGLPSQIISEQPTPTQGPATVRLLADAARLRAVVAGRSTALDPGELAIEAASPQVVRLRGSASTAGLVCETRGELECDGFYEIALSVRPKAEPVELERLAVEIPLDARWADLMSSIGDMVRGTDFCGAIPKGDGVVWHSMMTQNRLVKGNFLPFVWLGNEDRGLAYMADNDRGWILDASRPCLEIDRAASAVTFRIVLVNRPVRLERPLEAVFALQATPVKPLPRGWRSWIRATSVFERSIHKDWPTKEWPAGSMIDTYHVAPGRLEKPQHIGGVDPTDEQASRQCIEERYHRTRRKAFLYLNLRISPPNRAAFQDYAAEWGVIPGRPHNYSPVKSYQDYALWHLRRWFQSCNIDGVYLDDVFPVPSENLINGCGWVDEQGVTHAGYSLFSAREYVKRMAIMLKGLGRKPGIWAHTTNTPCTPYLGFADMFFDGENFGFPDPGIERPDYIDRWPYERLDRFRACSYTKQFGTVPVRLVRNIDRKLDANSAAALVLPHDIFFFTADHTYFVWALSRFGIWEDDVEFFPYWGSRRLVDLETDRPKIIASSWRRQDRMMLIVSNLGDDDARVGVKVTAEGIPPGRDIAAVDGVTQKEVAIADGRIEALSVGRHDYRLILVGPRRLLTIGEDTFGAALPKPKAVVEQTGNDFSGPVPPQWQINVSPQAPRASAYTWNDRLRVVTPLNRYAFAARDFALDRVSVQCCIEIESGDNMRPECGPAMMLSWEGGDYVKAGLWTGFRIKGERAPAYVFGVNRKLTKGPALPMRRETFYLWRNWVKLDLRPTTIDFYCSTDGESWTKARSVPRKGALAGRPSKLVLGCGHGSKATGHPAPFLMNDAATRTPPLPDYRYYHFSGVLIGEVRLTP